MAGIIDFISDYTAHVYNTITQPINTIFELRHSNIVSDDHWMGTSDLGCQAHWSRSLGGQVLCGSLLTATTHFMLLCTGMVYTSCIKQASTRVHIQYDAHCTPVLVREFNPGITVINPEILFNAQRATECERLYINTGCSISIVNSATQLINVCNIHCINIQGVAGSSTVSEAGNLHIKAADNAGVFRTIIVNNVLLYSYSPVNLLS
eukprot:2808795-Rhodomonas_salina.1